MHVELSEVTFPSIEFPTEDPAIVPSEQFEQRVSDLYARAGADWVLVYGDREHVGNLTFLCGYDPRFEEALLVLGPRDRRVLIVGNEGMGYTSVVTIRCEFALCQTFSLMGQKRDEAPNLANVLRDIGIKSSDRVAVAGWKYLKTDEGDPKRPAFVPAMILDAIPSRGVYDATALLLHPATGLMTRSSAEQIAAYAFAAERASVYALRIARGAKPGMTERQAAALMHYEGDPLSCHTMMVSGKGDIVGLRSPSMKKLEPGDGVTTAVGLRGGLCARAGMLLDRPEPAFMRNAVEPYFRAVATWWQSVRVGVSGGEISNAVHESLQGASFKPALNPGHLTGIEEWTHSPFREGSTEGIASGTMLQCDIIPAPLPPGQALNCEDTAVVADPALRAQLRAVSPRLWDRILARQKFMRESLGIKVPDDLLPLSVAPATLAPFWLARDLVCRVS